MNYIQVAIRKVKTVDLEEMRALKKKGHKTIRFKLEEASAKKKKAATAAVPLAWIVESRERYAVTQKEEAFKDFVSDWVSGWV